jgi:hypothetical protein
VTEPPPQDLLQFLSLVDLLIGFRLVLVALIAQGFEPMELLGAGDWDNMVDSEITQQRLNLLQFLSLVDSLIGFKLLLDIDMYQHFDQTELFGDGGVVDQVKWVTEQYQV